MQNKSWLIGAVVVPMGLSLAGKALFNSMRFDAGTYSSQSSAQERPDLKADWAGVKTWLNTATHVNSSSYRLCVISAHR